MTYSAWLNASLWTYSWCRPAGPETHLPLHGCTPQTGQECVCGGVGGIEDTHTCLRCRGRMWPPVLQVTEQGRHCLQPAPVCSPSLSSVARLSALPGLFLPRMAMVGGLSPFLGWKWL